MGDLAGQQAGGWKSGWGGRRHRACGSRSRRGRKAGEIFTTPASAEHSTQEGFYKILVLIEGLASDAARVGADARMLYNGQRRAALRYSGYHGE